MLFFHGDWRWHCSPRRRQGTGYRCCSRDKSMKLFIRYWEMDFPVSQSKRTVLSSVSHLKSIGGSGETVERNWSRSFAQKPSISRRGRLLYFFSNSTGYFNFAWRIIFHNFRSTAVERSYLLRKNVSINPSFIFHDGLRNLFPAISASSCRWQELSTSNKYREKPNTTSERFYSKRFSPSVLQSISVREFIIRVAYFPSVLVLRDETFFVSQISLCRIFPL